MQAGLPSWSTLIRPLAAEIGLRDLKDMPLAAEYFEQTAAGGRDRLELIPAEQIESLLERAKVARSQYTAPGS